MNKEIKLEKIFVMIALTIGLLLVYIVPPLAAPDENSHFANVYSYVYGLPPVLKNNEYGRYYPKHFVEFIKTINLLMLEI